MEEGNQSGELAISGGHGSAQEEYAMKRKIRGNDILATQATYRYAAASVCLIT